MSARIVSVNVGTPKTYTWLGRCLRSSIDKHPVRGPVQVLATRLAGDEQSDTQQHGGADKAVYAYSVEDYARWGDELGPSLDPGMFGENLTTEGLDLSTAAIGSRWHVDTAVLEVSEPRTPCWKLGMRMGDPAFPRAFAAARRPGVMLRVVAPGALQVGDAVDMREGQSRGVTAADVTAMYYGDPVDAAAVLATPQLAAHWRQWAAHRTVWHLDEERARGREGA